MPKQARGTLNLVDDDGRRITLKETLRLLLGLLGSMRETPRLAILSSNLGSTLMAGR
jgi:hypothetical protein